METHKARWIVAVLMLMLAACTHGYLATWPGCRPTTYWGEKLKVIQPDTIDLQADILHINECRLSRIQTDSFRATPSVRVIYMNKNQIQQIDAGSFDSTSIVEELVLSNNAFLGKNLPPNIFHKCRKLATLRLSGNDMRDSPRDLLMGLDISNLHLVQCSLQDVPSFVTHHSLPKLVYIDMSDNQIRRLDRPDTFASVPNLETLNLKNNQIEYLNEDIFNPLMEISNIYLNQNQLRNIPEKLFKNKFSLGTINLADNLIEHVPANAFKDTTELWDLNLGGNRLTYLPNEFFQVLQGRMEIFYFDRNPWQCGCLNEILIKVKKRDIQYEGKSFNGKEPVCMMNSFQCSKPQNYPQLYPVWGSQ